MGRMIGIDLGTTHSLAASMNRGVPCVISDRMGSPWVPSVVSFDKDGVVVGKAAKKHLIDNADRTVYSIKRFMGKGIGDIRAEDMAYMPFRIREKEGMAQIDIDGTSYSPPAISALILKELRRLAEDHLKEPVDQAVITVPAYFNHLQREATIEAGRMAGLAVPRVVNEPTAASLAYGLQRQKEGLIAVYDLGGGTFDISILKIKNGIFDVLATNGNTHLGGDDVDQRIMQLMLGEILDQYKVDLRPSPAALQEIRLIAEAAKCALSFEQSVDLVFASSDLGCEYRRPFTRNGLDLLARPWIESTIVPCRKALADAGLTPSDIDEVILVGGSTRMLSVQEAVADFFGKKPHSELPPEEVVAMGAAISADILEGGSTAALLLDVTPLTLGIETVDGGVSRLIPRNAKIPAYAKETYTTSVDGQTSVFIHVVQGERERVADCQSLAQFHLSGIAPMPAGTPRVEVTFTVDANGILRVEAVEQRTGKKQSVRVKPMYGLTAQQVSAILSESQQHEQEDVELHQLIMAKQNADLLIRHSQKGLADGSALIDSAEREQIERHLADLVSARAGTDRALIEETTGRLEQSTKHLAEVIMSAVLSGTLHAEANLEKDHATD